MSPIPDLPPIREDATLDASQFVSELQAMAREASAAAEAFGKLLAAIKGVQETMDGMAAGAAEAAAAEQNLASAEEEVAKGAAAAAGAQNAAAGAASNMARSDAAAGAAAFNLAKFQETLTNASLAAAAAERASADAADASRNAYAGMAAAQAAAAGEAEKLAAAEAAGSLYAAQGVANAKALAEADAALAAAQSVAADAAQAHAAAETFLATAMTAAERDALGLTTALAAATVANKVAADAAGNTGRAIGVQVGWLRLGAANWATFLHWVVAGSAEFLAVAVPAAVALAAGLAVASQGAQNAQIHFQALYAATESTYAAMHQTVGTVLGLGDALQKAQNAADPGVYEVLGSVINDLRGRTGLLAQAGLDVVHNFDEFAARVSVDMRQGLGTEIQGLISGMVTDLQQFGQVLGNLGHALLNFAAAMPGLAHVLLDIAVGLSQVVEWASRAGPLLTFGMALEETYRWGGLVLSMLVRLTGQMAVMNAFGAGNFVTRFGAALLTLVSLGGRVLIWAGQMIGRLAGVSAAFGVLGTSMAEAGAGAATFAAEMSPAMAAGIVGVAAAAVFLVAKLASMKTATEQWIASSDQMVAKASDLNVLPTIYRQLADTTTRLAGSQGQLAVSFDGVASRYNGLAGMTTHASQSSVDLANHLMSLVATADTVRGNISLLAGAFHTSQIGALALANAAGINLQVGLARGSEAAKIAEQQITNLKAGLGAMAAPAGMIGADMEAVGVQSQLAASKVGTVNQALDAFIGSTTGGMNSLMQFNAALSAMGKDTVSTSQSITGQIDSISRTAAKMGFTLQGIGPHAQQSWQQFDGAVQQANAILDTMRTGMAENVVSAKLYGNSILEAGGALLPFAAHNRTALAIVSQLAQEAGFKATTSMKTLAQDFGITGRAAQEKLAGGVERAIARMSNLNTVARNLSATVSGQLDAAMASAIVKASGLDQAYLRWATDVKNNAPAAALKADLAGITKAQDFVNTAEQKGTTLLNNSASAAGKLGTALKGAAGDAGGFTGQVSKTHAALQTAAVNAKTAAMNTQGFGSQAHTAAGQAQGLSSNAQQATAQVRNLGSAASTTRGSLGTVNNEIRATATAASGSTGPLSAMIGNIRTVGTSASAAAGQVHALASAIAGLQSKTITVTTNVVTVTSTVHRAMGGPVFPGVPTVVGEAGREMYIPAAAGYIVPHAQTEAILAGATGGSSRSPGTSPSVPLSADVHVQVNLDGRQVWKSVQTQALQWGKRNQGTPTGSLIPQQGLGL